MKRLIRVGLGLGLVVVMTLMSSLAAIAATSSNIGVLVNGKRVVFDVQPIIVQGRTLIPVRFVAETLGAKVEWDPVARAVTVVNGNTTVRLWIDSANATINGAAVRLDVPAVIVSDRTLVPLRFLAEMLEFIVDWDDMTRQVHLSAPGAIQPTRIVVASSRSTVRVGDLVTVDIRLENARSAYTAIVNLVYDGGVSAQSIKSGTILEGLLFQERFDNNNGSVDYAVSRVGQVRGFSGDGVLYSVTFRAVTAGSVQIMPTVDSMIVDSGLEALVVVRNGLWLTVNP